MSEPLSFDETSDLWACAREAGGVLVLSPQEGEDYSDEELDLLDMRFEPLLLRAFDAGLEPEAVLLVTHDVAGDPRGALIAPLAVLREMLSDPLPTEEPELEELEP